MAVIGRQKFVFFLICQHAMYASVPAIFIKAKRRAFSTSPRFVFCAAARAAACQGTGVLMYQKIADAVWSAVRVVEFREPTWRISSTSRA
jgi:hypothetical protein